MLCRVVRDVAPQRLTPADLPGVYIARLPFRSAEDKLQTRAHRQPLDDLADERIALTVPGCAQRSCASAGANTATPKLARDHRRNVGFDCSRAVQRRVRHMQDGRDRRAQRVIQQRRQANDAQQVVTHNSGQHTDNSWGVVLVLLEEVVDGAEHSERLTPVQQHVAPEPDNALQQLYRGAADHHQVQRQRRERCSLGSSAAGSAAAALHFAPPRHRIELPLLPLLRDVLDADGLVRGAASAE